jgi:hypothetical protein
MSCPKPCINLCGFAYLANLKYHLEKNLKEDVSTHINCNPKEQIEGAMTQF